MPIIGALTSLRNKNKNLTFHSILEELTQGQFQTLKNVLNRYEKQLAHQLNEYTAKVSEAHQEEVETKYQNNFIDRDALKRRSGSQRRGQLNKNEEQAKPGRARQGSSRPPNIPTDSPPTNIILNRPKPVDDLELLYNDKQDKLTHACSSIQQAFISAVNEASLNPILKEI